MMKNSYRMAISLLSLLAVLFSAGAATGRGGAQSGGTARFELVDQIGGAPSGLAVNGSYAYISIGQRLVVLDVSDARRPQFAGQTTPLAGLTRDLAVKDRYAYVALPDGLSVVDVSKPDRPRLVKSLQLPYVTFESPPHLAIEKDRLYLSSNGLHVFDLSDPVEIREISSLSSTPLFVRDLTAASGFVFMAAGNAGLNVVASRPGVPGAETAGVIQDGKSQRSMSVFLAGDHLFSGWSGGMELWDISDPLHAIRLSQIGDTYLIRDLAVSGNILFALEVGAPSQHASKLRVFDVSDLSSPGELGSYDFAWLSPLEMVLSGNVAYLLDAQGLHTLDVSVPTRVRELGAFFTAPDSPVDIALDGDRALVYGLGSGSRFFDISNPTSPLGGDLAPFLGEANDIITSRGQTFVVSSNGLRILDTRDRKDPRFTGVLNTYGDPRVMVPQTLALNGDIAYLPAIQWFLVLDVSDAARPQEIYAIQTAGGSFRPALSGQTLYMSELGGGLRIYDISDPKKPVEAGYFPIDGPVTFLQIEKDRAYIAIAHRSLQILDIADRLHPKVTGRYEFFSPENPSQARSIAISNETAYFSDETGVLHAVDLSHPQAPQEIASIQAGIHFDLFNGRLAARGDLLYAPNLDRGLLVYRLKR